MPCWCCDSDSPSLGQDVLGAAVSLYQQLYGRLEKALKKLLLIWGTRSRFVLPSPPV
jgi:hypothetical protein